jgi:hypothetical protein
LSGLQIEQDQICPPSASHRRYGIGQADIFRGDLELAVTEQSAQSGAEQTVAIHKHYIPALHVPCLRVLSRLSRFRNKSQQFFKD